MIDIDNYSYIETSRLYLKYVNIDNAQDMFEYCNDEETVFYLDFDRHLTLNDTINSIKSYFMLSPFGKYGIFIKDNDKMIGTIDIRLNNNEYSNLGWVINKNYRNKGYCSEALLGLISFYSSKLNIRELYAIHEVSNIASERVMDKANFIKLNKFFKKEVKKNERTMCIHKLQIKK
ncbi:GNAT family N-acetyltransferase [Spiroplasma turonicum]|uniref:Acetyltransferase, GNAT family n=1 Tax=Spiroplasma turonicum TaxID=216946 RepID=A0A0K1P6X2_9MOLU|nr:GNAT family N-acetyltransferase [Spiroplasma turonicum]AKU80020.1 acetyltransferase, GNAT family [Spiroplasma turonicum]ALX71022.1 ribosomal-protein-alanine N-acetyltransferase [Spiroplasma turonicum]